MTVECVRNGVDLKLVGDLGHEGGDLLHEALNLALRAGLEERRDGERGNRAVRIRDHILQVQVAECDSEREGHSDSVQRAHGGEPKRGLRRR